MPHSIIGVMCGWFFLKISVIKSFIVSMHQLNSSIYIYNMGLNWDLSWVCSQCKMYAYLWGGSSSILHIWDNMLKGFWKINRWLNARCVISINTLVVPDMDDVMKKRHNSVLGQHWFSNGLVPSGTKPLLEPVLTKYFSYVFCITPWI